MITLLITGKLGHRGVDETKFIHGIVRLQEELACRVVFSSDESVDDVWTNFFTRKGWSLTSSSNLGVRHAGPARSLVIQSLQVKRGLDNVEVPCSNLVVRIRTDWVIENPKSFRLMLERFVKSGKQVGALVVNSFSPFIPIPYYFEDLMIIGKPEVLARFWRPWEGDLDANFQDRCSILDLSVFLSIGSPRVTVEQLLWYRFFNEVNPPKGAFRLTIAEVCRSASFSNQVFKFDSRKSGCVVPDHLRSKNVVAKRFYPGDSLESRPKSMVALAIFSALTYKVLFFAHPHWIAPRFLYLARMLRERRGPSSKTVNTNA